MTKGRALDPSAFVFICTEFLVAVRKDRPDVTMADRIDRPTIPFDSHRMSRFARCSIALAKTPSP